VDVPWLPGTTFEFMRRQTGVYLRITFSDGVNASM